MNTPWAKIMEEFRGRRLAVHDDLLRGRTVAYGDVNVQNALGWLIYHRLVTLDNGSRRACDVPEAKRNWQEHGPATEAAQTFAAQASAKGQVPSARATTATALERPRVHDHQAKLFAEACP